MQRVVRVEEICNERCDIPNVGRLVNDVGDDQEHDKNGSKDLYLLYSIRRGVRFIARARKSKRPSAEIDRIIDIGEALAVQPSTESSDHEEKLLVSIYQSYPGWLQVRDFDAGPGRAMRTMEQVLLSHTSQFLTCFSMSSFLQPQASSGIGVRLSSFRHHPHTVPAGSVLTIGNTFSNPEENVVDGKFSCCKSLNRILGNKNSSEEEILIQCLDVSGRRLIFPLRTTGHFYSVTFNNSVDDKNSDRNHLVYQIRDLARFYPLPSHIRIVYGPLVTGSQRILIDNDLELLEKREDKSLLACRIEGAEQQFIEEFPSNCGLSFEIPMDKFTISQTDKSTATALRYCNDNVDEFMTNIQLASHYSKSSVETVSHQASKDIRANYNPPYSSNPPFMENRPTTFTANNNNNNDLNIMSLTSASPSKVDVNASMTSPIALESSQEDDSIASLEEDAIDLKPQPDPLADSHSVIGGVKQDSTLNNSSILRNNESIELHEDNPEEFNTSGNLSLPEVFHVPDDRPTSNAFSETDAISIPEEFRNSTISFPDPDKQVDGFTTDHFSLKEAEWIRDSKNLSESDGVNNHRNTVSNSKNDENNQTDAESEVDSDEQHESEVVRTELNFKTHKSGINPSNWRQSDDMESCSDEIVINEDSVTYQSNEESAEDDDHILVDNDDIKDYPTVRVSDPTCLSEDGTASEQDPNRCSFVSYLAIDTSEVGIPSQFTSDAQDDVYPSISDLQPLEIPAPESFSDGDGIQNLSPIGASSDVTIKGLNDAAMRVEHDANETSNKNLLSQTYSLERAINRSESPTSSAFDADGYLIPVEKRNSVSPPSNSPPMQENRRNQHILSPRLSHSKDDPNMMMILQRHGSASQENIGLNGHTTQSEARYDSERLQLFLEDSVTHLHRNIGYTSSVDDGQGSAHSEVIARQHSVPWTRRPSDPSHAGNRTRGCPDYRRQNSGRLLEGINTVQVIDEDDISDFDNSSSNRNGSLSRNQDSGLYIDLLDRRDSEKDLLWMPIGELQSWSVEEVVLALRYIGIKEEIVMEFSQEKIDGGLLAEMTPEIVEEAFPRMNALQRNKLMKLIDGWRPKHTMHSYV